MKKIKTIVLISTLIMIMVVTGCSSGGAGIGGAKTFNLSTGVEIGYEGLDTKGTSYIDFDDEILFAEISSELGIEPDTDYYELEQNDPETYEKLLKIDKLYRSVELELDKTENLSNGDIATLTLRYNEPLAEEIGYKFELSKTEYEVTGLQEATIISGEELMKNAEVEFMGVSPDVTVAVKNNSDNEVLKTIPFYANKESKIRKGDTIVVYPELDHEFLNSRGYIVELGNKEFVAENVDEYITSFDQITDEVLEEIVKQSNDIVKAYLIPKESIKTNIKGDYNKARSDEINNITLDKAYFSKHKKINDNDIETRNALRLCYTYDIKGADIGSWGVSEYNAEYKNVNLYTYITNIVITKDGELKVDPTSVQIAVDKTEIDKDTFIDSFMTKNLNNYEFEEIPSEEFTENTEV